MDTIAKLKAAVSDLEIRIERGRKYNESHDLAAPGAKRERARHVMFVHFLERERHNCIR